MLVSTVLFFLILISCKSAFVNIPFHRWYEKVLIEYLPGDVYGSESEGSEREIFLYLNS